VHEIAYSGSYNTFEVVMADKTKIKVTQTNTSRHDDELISWGSEVYCWWDETAPVALTS
jgi:putrescine transport system ATP-binding protein